MGNIEILEESAAVLPEYATILISFEVHSIFDVQVIDGGLGGFRLSEQQVSPTWVKDYDAVETEGPRSWAARWDISNWGVLSAFSQDVRVGGCVIAYDTPGVNMLESRKDIAVLWDLRVAPEHRGMGIGGRLIETAAVWAERRGCRLFKVETQNINVPACRAYARHGFTLGAINRHAYSELPDEVQLIWYRKLDFGTA